MSNLQRLRARGALGAAIACLACMLAAFAFAGVASATHSGGQGGANKDSLDGTDIRTLISLPTGVFPSNQHVNAQNAAAGGIGGEGHFWIKAFVGPGTEQEIRGEVTCLNNVGTQALYSGSITSSRGPTDYTGLGWIGKVVDNGEPGSDTVTPDLSGGSILSGGLASCPPPQFVGLPMFPIEQGNFIVHDGV